MTDQSKRSRDQDLEWRGDVPVSRQFDDPYYSLDDGVAETWHVFLAGNDLPDRFCDGFHIAELGFGTGLNLLVALQAFRAAGIPGKLRYTSFEAFPLPLEAMQQAQRPFKELAALAQELAPQWGASEITLQDLEFRLIVGDARDRLPNTDLVADAWFLDGFSPAKNPELWDADLLRAVGEHTAPGGTCATYTAAGHVRRALDAAGFEISRVPGFGRKRHMSVGRRR
ncbi:tRNA (5-methylaminomethyl-2-thiouridine)(34)-methyltransferase MnmD [Primorskyibacter sp. S187A]|uniref:tRNA (5-methylaminomethyl-2-thiouridine)(34)-methyltransferase MnmD n=1 Tax=Primorskyibacter sp. S187A TaxID=3415130 RepID=UPI003C7AA5C0